MKKLLPQKRKFLLPAAFVLAFSLAFSLIINRYVMQSEIRIYNKTPFDLEEVRVYDSDGETLGFVKRFMSGRHMNCFVDKESSVYIEFTDKSRKTVKDNMICGYAFPGMFGKSVFIYYKNDGFLLKYTQI